MKLIKQIIQTGVGLAVVVGMAACNRTELPPVQEAPESNPEAVPEMTPYTAPEATPEATPSPSPDSTPATTPADEETPPPET